MTEIEKARDGIFQRLLVAQGPMSRSVVKSIMEDIDELCKLHCISAANYQAHLNDCAIAVNGRHECSCKDQSVIAHWSASTWGHHECSCGCFAFTTEGGDGEPLESCREEDE